MALACASPNRLGIGGSCVGPPQRGVPLLYMAAGQSEVGLWDVMDGRCHLVLRTLDRAESLLSAPELPAALQPALPLPAAPAVAAAVAAQPPSQTDQATNNTHHGQVDTLAAELATLLGADRIQAPAARCVPCNGVHAALLLVSFSALPPYIPSPSTPVRLHR